MDERELEQRLRMAVEHAAPDPLDRILASCGPRRAEVIPFAPPKKKRRWAPLAVAAALALGAPCALARLGNPPPTAPLPAAAQPGGGPPWRPSPRLGPLNFPALAARGTGYAHGPPGLAKFCV